MLHARNIVQARPYADTGYVYNPGVPYYSPRTYPPVFPLLLAPIYRFGGPNLMLMKLEEAVLFLLALGAIYGYFRPDLPPTYLLALIAVLAYNPRFWADKDNVLSDFPFLLFFYLTACLVRFAPRDKPAWYKWAVLTGLALYLCIGTRAVGLALIPGFILHEVVKSRKITAFAVVAILACASLCLLQGYFTGSGEGSYFDQLHPTFAQVAGNIWVYSGIVGTFWLGSVRSAFSFTLLAIVVVLTPVGAYFHIKRGLTVVDTFLLPYFAVIVVWSSLLPGLRFMFPALPFLVYLALLGLHRLVARSGPRYSNPALVALLSLVALCYLLTYRNLDYGPIQANDGLPSFNDVCRVISTRTAPQDLLIFRRPRALALLTARHAALYQTSSDADLWGFVRSSGATHIVSSEIFDTDRDFLIPFLHKYSSHFELLYQNSDFKLYRICSYVTPPLESPSRPP